MINIENDDQNDGINFWTDTNNAECYNLPHTLSLLCALRLKIDVIVDKDKPDKLSLTESKDTPAMFEKFPKFLESVKFWKSSLINIKQNRCPIPRCLFPNNRESFNVKEYKSIPEKVISNNEIKTVLYNQINCKISCEKCGFSINFDTSKLEKNSIFYRHKVEDCKICFNKSWCLFGVCQSCLLSTDEETQDKIQKYYLTLE